MIVCKVTVVCWKLDTQHVRCGWYGTSMQSQFSGCSSSAHLATRAKQQSIRRPQLQRETRSGELPRAGASAADFGYNTTTPQEPQRASDFGAGATARRPGDTGKVTATILNKKISYKHSWSVSNTSP